MIYFDNAATTQVDSRVVDVMGTYLTQEYGNPSSMHKKGAVAKKAIDAVRKQLSVKLGCDPGNIVFTCGGTESNNLGIIGYALAHRDRGMHIVTSKVEHKSVLGACEYLERYGFTVTYLDVDFDGKISLDQLRNVMSTETILVALGHGNSEIGTMQDLASIGALCKGKKVALHVDFVQSFGKVPVRLSDISLASFSAHKIHGPKGVGALYVGAGVEILPLVHGGGQESGLRSGTQNVPGIIGFGEAIGLLKQYKDVEKLRDRLEHKLVERIEHCKILGKNRLPHILSVAFSGVEGERLLLHLDKEGICVSLGSACGSAHRESHVLQAIGLPDELRHGVVRFSLSCLNTKEEVDSVVGSVERIVGKLRGE